MSVHAYTYAGVCRSYLYIYVNLEVVLVLAEALEGVEHQRLRPVVPQPAGMVGVGGLFVDELDGTWGGI